MAWFDGTFEWTDKELNKEFTIKITDDFMMGDPSEMKIALINNFKEDTALYEISDPHVEYMDGEDDDCDCSKDYQRTVEGRKFVFYHAFFDEDADRAKEAMDSFRCSDNYNKSESISLLRRTEDGLILYSFGYICTDIMDKQDELKKLIPADITYDRFFIVPLRRYFEKCPVCGHRTLQYRGMYEICVECGWEDSDLHFDGEDDNPIANMIIEIANPNGCHIDTYRELYKIARKAHPDLAWNYLHHEIMEMMPDEDDEYEYDEDEYDEDECDEDEHDEMK